MAEKKYIELQKALNVCEMHYEHCLEMHDWSGDATADNIKRDIETIPIADVADVVRCKGCRYYSQSRNFGGEIKMYCDKWSLDKLIYTKPDDFCSYGERRTDDEM